MTAIASQTGAGCGKGHGAPGKPRTVALSVVADKPKGDPHHIRKSKSSRWRAAVLISVNLLMIGHIIQWKLSETGATLSPVEPSESMYTLETGRLNAGFIFFAAALLSTFVFGRFFCGWGCHVVALQDLCSTIMERLGVRPKPFRSRVLLWGPLLLALYMFAWVPFKRLALFPLFRAISWFPPSWLLTDPGKAPKLTSHLVVTEFWQTFPSWFVAIPFLLVCGFATVYFLGSKGFCTYACPYGGLFAPMDKISVGRIVVSDACEGCGHCTAVCSSNVRVHQEVRDFGMVVDPGCMKCLDCVSVCPNNALSFSFARPSVLAKPRTAEAIAGHVQRPEYDLTIGQDLGLFVLTILLFMAYRGMFLTSVRGELGMVPLLMAAGMAAIGSFAVWKLVALFAQPNVRLQSLQLRTKGRFRIAGIAFALGAITYLGLGAWSGAVHVASYVGGLYDDQILVSADKVFTPGYTPDETDKANALEALRWIERSGPVSGGGFGWPYTTEGLKRRAWLFAVAGDLAAAERSQREAIAQAKPMYANMVFDLGRIMMAQGRTPADVSGVYEQMLIAYPRLHQVRLELAAYWLMAYDSARAITLCEQVINAEPLAEADELARAAELLMQANQLDLALAASKAASERYPGSGLLHAVYGRALWFKDQRTDAVIEMRRATDLMPTNAVFFHVLAEMFGEMGRTAEADEAERTAQSIDAANAVHK